MRADRLLSILLLLQTRGRMTARQLSQELEVSERTIYRDVVALNTAGVPIYTQDGPGGGISLVDNYQTRLTGLLPQEAQALAMLDIPEPLLTLSVGQELKNALLKLSAAVTPTIRDRQVQIHNRIYLDATWWFQEEEPTPNLQIIKEAVYQDLLVEFTYQMDFNTLGRQTIAPYGLVAKANIWFLVYSHAQRLQVKRISHILSVKTLPQSFNRPDDFDLIAFWKSWCTQYEKGTRFFEVTVLVSPALSDRLPYLLRENQPDRLPTLPVNKQEDWKVMKLYFDNFETARSKILGYGGAVKVLEPIALRASLLDFTYQIQKLYQD